MLLLQFSHVLLVCIAISTVTAFNITIMIYGAWPAFLLQSIPCLGPGFDTAVAQVRQQYADLLNITHVYVASRNVKECADTGPYYTDVVDYYYRYRDGQDADEITVLFYAGCDGDPTFALLAAEWDVFVASFGTSFSNFRDRALYPTTINAGPVQYDLYGTTIVSLCNTYNWTNVGFVYQLAGVYPFGPLVYGRIIAYLKRHASHIRIIPITIQQNPNTKDVNYDALFLAITQSCRVVLISMAPWFTREVMIQAHQRKLTTGSDYAWFTVDLNENALGPLRWQRNKPDDEIARQSFVSLFQIIGCWEPKTEEMNRFKVQWRSDTVMAYNATWPTEMGPSQYTESAFGLVHVLAQAIRNVSLRGLDVRSGRALAGQLSGSFSVVPSMSEPYRIDNNGERQNRICVDNFNYDSGQFERAIYADFLGQSLQAFPNRSLIWNTFDRQPPQNSPECGYSGRDPKCKQFSLPTLVGCVAAGTVAVAVLAGIYLWKMRMSAEKDESWWRINASELQETVDSTEMKSSGLSLLSGSPVWTRTIPLKQRSFPNRNATALLRKIRRINHTNVVTIIGVVVTDVSIKFVTEYCKRGCLTQVIGNVRKDAELRGFMIMDLVEGVHAIHSSTLKYHGNLSHATCLIDNRFTLKISHPGIYELINTIAPATVNEETKLTSDKTAATSSELTDYTRTGGRFASSASDIYAVALIIDSLFPNGSATDYNVHLLATLEKVESSPRLGPPPQVLTPKFLEILFNSRSINIADRPSITNIRSAARSIFGNGGQSLVASLLLRLRKNAELLEDAVTQRTSELKNEMIQSDTLLGEILPKRVVHDMRLHGAVAPEAFASVTVMFTYVLGFGEFVADNGQSSLAVIDFLNQMFMAFDHVLTSFDVYKVETINDSYMVASGLPERNGEQHASEICLTALGFLHTFVRCWSSLPLAIKFGINTGPCVTGVVGRKRPRYCLFGDTVNTASRLASHGEAWKIHISSLTHETVRASLRTELRGKVQLKGKGEVDTYWLTSQT